MFKHAIIISGGEGTRMRPLTQYIPKALVNVDGQPLVYHSIERFNKQGVENVMVTYNYLADTLFHSLNMAVDGFINTVNQDNAYFLFNSVVKYLDEPVLVIPCDVILDIDLTLLYNDYRRHQSPAIMIVGVKPNEGSVGDYIKYNDYNVIEALSREEISPQYCSGLQVINPAKVNRLMAKKDNFYEVWNKLIGTPEFKVSSMHPTSWEAYDNIHQII